MAENNLKNQQASSYISGNSAAYIEALYEDYLRDPSSVNADWRNYFDLLAKSSPQQMTDISHQTIRDQFRHHALQKTASHINNYQAGDVEHERKRSRVIQLINAFRSYGHHHAQLDPLALHERERIADLELGYHGLSHDDLDKKFVITNFPGVEHATLKEIIHALNMTYCGTLGVEYLHITKTDEVHWIQQRLEPIRSQPQFNSKEKTAILKLLAAGEGLEKYLGSRYVGQKRFGLDGAESLIPMLNDLVHRAGVSGLKEVVIGMAHRGRLNVLVNILGKPPASLFAEFEGKHSAKKLSGDVKYHMGFSSDIETPGGNVHLALAFNPSHLEIINPVVEGSVKARQERRSDYKKDQVLPVLIHGDAAFAGQGVVMETFNFSKARSFDTGGTVHIVINNQIGFTTSNPLDARSTLYCTDIAKMVQAPIFHVNTDDPETAVLIMQIALDYRMRFNKDIVIDLVCYRRHGHNEADEPSGTQPLMYKKIKKHPTVCKIYGEKLVAENTMTADQVKQVATEYRDALDKGEPLIEALVTQGNNKFSSDWTPFLDTNWRDATSNDLSLKALTKIGNKVTELPEDFSLQPQVAKVIANRQKMIKGEIPIDWGFAETLAYASLVDQDYAIRLCGQDSGRGTFSHRHAVLHHYQTGQVHIPLQHVSDEQGKFTVIDSVLSEEAVLGFEYGYATTEPNTLVIWEAQFGDFANGAQVLVDQFISSGEQKWGRLCGLVMLLPHGYEGQGPEHSSARLERYLQLCAQDNIQVCVPSTPAQVFHMLRRQLLRPYRKPLIVMSPKSLLRHRLAVSTLDELATGEFKTLIDEIDDIKTKKVQRVILCCGKVYYDLLEKRRELKLDNIAIIRIEQLYPFPDIELKQIFNKYKHVKEIVWCQEEPMNQGAWLRRQTRIGECLSEGQVVTYAGREESASPAAGYLSLHNAQQKALVAKALGV